MTAVFLDIAAAARFLFRSAHAILMVVALVAVMR